MPITDEYTLLCETCGYTVDGLPVEGKCPECGRAIRTSIPEAREGTPWDRGPSVRSWFATGWMVVTRPGRTFESMRIGSQARPLLLLNCFIAAAVASACLWLPSRNELRMELPGELAAYSIALLVAAITLWVLALWGILLVLTLIERLGLRTIGRLRRWRITSTITLGVCATATYGWIAGSIVVGTTTLAVTTAPGGWEKLLGTMAYWRFIAIPVAALVGLLIFETLVYIGVRRCKFANRARPSPVELPTQPHA